MVAMAHLTSGNRRAALVIALAMTLGMVCPHDEEHELLDLSDHDLLPKTPQLKEAIGLRNNPKCPPSAFPNCMHGASVDQNTCTCKCTWNRLGKKCEKCNAKACKNGGTMDMGKCECKCQPGFSGPSCAEGSKCLNGAKEVNGACQCANAWSGPTCTTCNLACQNGGTGNPKTCSCNCPAPYQPPTCDTCKDPGCKNGGTWSAKKCKCVCPKMLAFSGLDCGQCVNPKCAHGTFDPKACKCKCPNAGWRGKRCDQCKRVCDKGRSLDRKSCECVEGKIVSYNPCKTGCKHGELDQEKCKCKCEAGWKGIFCDQCENDKCFNNGEHDGETCECKCIKPWDGPSCKICSLKCKHGDLKPKCGGCKCHPVAGGSWTGELCDKCEHEPCLNGGTLDSASCKCKCRKGYSGPTCATCFLTKAVCKNGGKFRPEKCDCDCKDTVGDWSGRFCGKCDHRGCKHGGEVDKKTCKCRCVPMWKGRYCDTCGNGFCKPKATKWVPGQEGFTSLTSKPECKWIRDLGCPGGLN